MEIKTLNYSFTSIQDNVTYILYSVKLQGNVRSIYFPHISFQSLESIFFIKKKKKEFRI